MNRRDLPELTAFVAAADHLSVRAAASRLHVTPSALSHSMRQLEERLGVRLLHRTTRSVSVTDASLLLLERHRTARLTPQRLREFYRAGLGDPSACGEFPPQALADTGRCNHDGIATGRLAQLIEYDPAYCEAQAESADADSVGDFAYHDEDKSPCSLPEGE